MAFHKRLGLWLSGLVFGIIMPLCLAWILFYDHYQSLNQKRIEARFTEMGQALEPLELFHADEKFFHGLFSRNFKALDESGVSKNALAKKLAAFKKLFPDRIRFIVWNKQGKIITELTDESGYRYVLRNMHKVMLELKRHYAAKVTASPVNIASIKRHMKLLQAYFGDYLRQNLLFEPLKPAHIGSTIIASQDAAKRMLWFYAGSNFSLACFADEALRHQNIGAKLLINAFNKKSSRKKLGYFISHDYRHHGLPGSEAQVTELKIEAVKFLNYATPLLQSDNYLLVFSQVSKNLTALCYWRKEPFNPKIKANQALAQIIKWLLIALFIFYCYQKSHPRLYLSVVHKMQLLFFFATALPLLIMISVGYGFFFQRQEHLINQEQLESLRLLREIDLRYPLIEEKIAKKLNNKVDLLNELYGAQKWPKNEIFSFRQLIERMQPDEAGIRLSSEKTIMHVVRSKKVGKSMLLGIGDLNLKFFNSQKPDFSAKRFISDVSSIDMLLFPTLARFNKFATISYADKEIKVFRRFLGNQKTYQNWGLLAVSWAPEHFMNLFFPDELKAYQKNLLPRQILVMTGKEEKLTADPAYNSREIRHLMRQTKSRKLIRRKNIEINGRNYLFCAIAASNMPGTVLAALYPQQLTAKAISRLKMALILAGLLLFVALLVIVKHFSQRLIKPINSLDNGLQNLAAKNYDCKIRHATQDEFGDLATAFNDTTEGLKELAIGTAVQTGLLPEENFCKGKCKLFARSIFMSKMGGDYYDYYSLKHNKLLVFFGDAAGHGIPAAMLMAMVKSVVASTIADGNYSPSRVLESTAPVFAYLKKNKWRRMMTAQALEIDCQSGEFALANAGQCYPIIVRNKTHSIEFCQANGMPLGNRARDPYKTTTWQLEPGDTLILYSDGIIEAANQAGEPFGFARLEQLLKDSAHTDLNRFWQQIYLGYSQWTFAPEDDVTLLFIRFENEK